MHFYYCLYENIDEKYEIKPKRHPENPPASASISEIV